MVEFSAFDVVILIAIPSVSFSAITQKGNQIYLIENVWVIMLFFKKIQNTKYIPYLSALTRAIRMAFVGLNDGRRDICGDTFEGKRKQTNIIRNPYAFQRKRGNSKLAQHYHSSW